VLLHEMPLLSVLADPAPVGSMLGQLIGSAMEAGGPRAALEAFLRFAYGDDVFDGIDAAVRDRLLQNADMVFEIEMPAYQAYRPDEGALSSLTVPARVLVGEEQAVPFFGEAAGWLASRVGTTVTRSPGAHAPHLSHARSLAGCIAALDPAR
jgi:pimeloyl-ACP methyl ester carboxylesterase